MSMNINSTYDRSYFDQARRELNEIVDRGTTKLETLDDLTPRYTQKVNKVYKRIYKYYGVTQADIENKTERYKDLLSTLSMH